LNGNVKTHTIDDVLLPLVWQMISLSFVSIHLRVAWGFSNSLFHGICDTAGIPKVTLLPEYMKGNHMRNKKSGQAPPY